MLGFPGAGEGERTCFSPERLLTQAPLAMSLQKLLNPCSIAIVGASDKVGPGFNAWNALKHVGFGGMVYLVNPTKTELLGQKCYPSLDAINSDIDAAFVAVKAENVLDVARQAAAKKAGGMAILSSGFGDAGAEGLRLQNELVAFAAEVNLSVCGPNCLGLLNFAGKTALFGTSLPDEVK